MNKRYLWSITCVLAFGLILTGCDNKSDQHKRDGDATISIGNTHVSVKDSGSNAQIPLPPNMPAYAAVYPGADIKAVVTVNEAEVGTMISYTTSAKQEDVLAFYKKNAAAASLQTVQELRVNNVVSFMAKGQNSGANLVVTMLPENGTLSVQETYK